MACKRHNSPSDGYSHPPMRQKEITMETCSLCEEQSRKTHRGKPHQWLIKIDECRVFSGAGTRGHEEQDYKCLDCDSRFTWSTGKNDLSWTLWQG